MYLYRVFSFCVLSEIKMPEFLASTDSPDVVFKYGSLIPPKNSNDENPRIIIPSGDGILLHWRMIGTFFVENGNTVTISPQPEVDDWLIRLVLTGPVLGVLLFQRGCMVYHASVVASIDTDSALAFVARKGEGKSTMSAAMYNSGYGMVSDDMMCVSIKDNVLMVPPGFPHAKLWKDSASVLIKESDCLPHIGPDFEKRSLTITERFIKEIKQLKAVFVLETAPQLSIERLSGYEAIQQLLPHWYGALFDGQLMPILGRERYFQETASLATHVPIYRLKRPRSFELLPHIVDEITNLISKQSEEFSHA